MSELVEVVSDNAGIYTFSGGLWKETGEGNDLMVCHYRDRPDDILVFWGEAEESLTYRVSPGHLKSHGISTWIVCAYNVKCEPPVEEIIAIVFEHKTSADRFKEHFEKVTKRVMAQKKRRQMAAVRHSADKITTEIESKSEEIQSEAIHSSEKCEGPITVMGFATMAEPRVAEASGAAEISDGPVTLIGETQMGAASERSATRYTAIEDTTVTGTGHIAVGVEQCDGDELADDSADGTDDGLDDDMYVTVTTTGEERILEAETTKSGDTPTIGKAAAVQIIVSVTHVSDDCGAVDDVVAWKPPKKAAAKCQAPVTLMGSALTAAKKDSGVDAKCEAPITLMGFAPMAEPRVAEASSAAEIGSGPVTLIGGAQIGKTSKRKVHSAPSSWTCVNCTLENQLSAMQCEACGNLNPIEEQRVAEASSAVEIGGDPVTLIGWAQMGEASELKVDLTPISWTCANCTLENPISAMQCEACGSLHPIEELRVEASTAAEMESTPISWKCANCTLENPISAMQCEACDSHKLIEVAVIGISEKLREEASEQLLSATSLIESFDDVKASKVKRSDFEHIASVICCFNDASDIALVALKGMAKNLLCEGEIDFRNPKVEERLLRV